MALKWPILPHFLVFSGQKPALIAIGRDTRGFGGLKASSVTVAISLPVFIGILPEMTDL